MTAKAHFSSFLLSVEQQLTRALALNSLPLTHDLATLEGAWKAQTVHLQARTYAGQHVRFARFVQIEGADLHIANVLCLPAVDRTLPILGVDLVDVGRDVVVVVADLSHVSADPAERAREIGVVRRHRGLGRTGDPALVPAWAAPWFSSEALVMRPPTNDAAHVLPAVQAFVSAFTALATASVPTNQAYVDGQHHAYCVAHREHDRGLQMLKKIFAPDLADRFLRQVLFPERLPS